MTRTGLIQQPGKSALLITTSNGSRTGQASRNRLLIELVYKCTLGIMLSDFRMGYMSDYIASKDAEYDSMNDNRSWMDIYLESKDCEDSWLEDD